MTWMRTGLIAFLCLLLGFLVYSKIFWPSTIFSAPEILARLYAKEYCSCVFVVKQSLKRCHEENDQIVPASQVEVMELDSGKVISSENTAGTAVHEKKIIARVLGYTAQAHWVSERFGCVQE